MHVTLFGTFLIAAAVGYLSEWSRFTRNGYIPSILICIGGAFVFYLVRSMFGIGFGSHGLNAIASSVGALAILPFHWRK